MTASVATPQKTGDTRLPGRGLAGPAVKGAVGVPRLGDGKLRPVQLEGRNNGKSHGHRPASMSMAAMKPIGAPIESTKLPGNGTRNAAMKSSRFRTMATNVSAVAFVDSTPSSCLTSDGAIPYLASS